MLQTNYNRFQQRLLPYPKSRGYGNRICILCFVSLHPTFYVANEPLPRASLHISLLKEIWVVLLMDKIQDLAHDPRPHPELSWGLL